ncbi:hypothetical protein I2485_14335 [Nesterenkonia sp. E16_7]|uniref:hypothetical protein n=1 Tax=unclassified Nesterenkonia TaxID=2629769 RepID=UPI001A929E5F|nr:MULTISPECIES: hypothetical protein [unclassified Nesterenkonia]MBO0594888.1 hypothetical protein [Nesterenkonia sp. E16_10]MBO0599824.1 hypothetical protein [Nesterenkonia sp. E16_7]
MSETHVTHAGHEDVLIPVIDAAGYTERRRATTLRKLRWSRSVATTMPVIAILALVAYVMFDGSETFPFWAIPVPLILGGSSATYRHLVIEGIQKDALHRLDTGQASGISRNEINLAVSMGDAQLNVLRTSDFSNTRKVILLSAIFVLLCFSLTSLLIMFNTILELNGFMRLLMFFGSIALALVFAILAFTVYKRIENNANAVVAARGINGRT